MPEASRHVRSSIDDNDDGASGGILCFDARDCLEKQIEALAVGRNHHVVIEGRHGETIVAPSAQPSPTGQTVRCLCSTGRVQVSTGVSQPQRRPLRVAVLDHTADLGGAELALARLARAISPGVVELHVFAFAPGPLLKQIREAGHAAEMVPLPGGMAGLDRHSAGRLGPAIRSALRLLPFTWRLARRLRDLDVDVIHTTSLKADLISVPLAVLTRRPVVWHVHDRIAADYLPAMMVQVIRALARRVPAHVIANSAATGTTLPGVGRLRIAHPGLTPEQVAHQPRQAAPSGAPVVGVVGRISPTKAQLQFVKAAAIVAAQRPLVRFRVVGAATFGAEEYEARVRGEVARLGLTDRVDFVGFVDDPTREVDAMSVCVHTAAVPEPFGQVVVEAMARGVPVVATAGGGVDEILDPQSGEPLGWIVAPLDETALAAAISEALDNPEEALRRAARAWQRAASDFTIEGTADVIVSTWRQVASANKTRFRCLRQSPRKQGRLESRGRARVP